MREEIIEKGKGCFTGGKTIEEALDTEMAGEMIEMEESNVYYYNRCI